jgi:hypothetical protein
MTQVDQAHAADFACHCDGLDEECGSTQLVS